MEMYDQIIENDSFMRFSQPHQQISAPSEYQKGTHREGLLSLSAPQTNNEKPRLVPITFPQEWERGTWMSIIQWDFSI